VTIPAYTDSTGRKHPASRNKLNAAFAFGGSKLTIETIEKATGIRIDHYVEIDLGGFVRMVNAIGGVDVCVADPISDKDSNLQLPAGKSHLDGVQSLAFVRARHIYADQDLGRIKAQQRFVGSMIKRATSKGILLDPLKLNRFLSAAVKSIDTDMSKDELLDEMKLLRDFKPGNVSFLTVPISNSNLYVPGVGSAASWNKKQARELFTKLRNDEPLEKKATAAKLTVLPGAITVQVLNGAGVQGLGAQAADDLARLGFGMADVAKNADVSNQSATVVKYDPTNVAASRTVLAAIPGATGLAVPGLGKTVEVVVGSTYSGAKAVSVTGSTSTKPKARTAADDVCK
jgi:LCP family protein required for cell wall assembly